MALNADEVGSGGLRPGPNTNKMAHVDAKSGATSRSAVIDYALAPKELNDAAVARFQYGIDKGHGRNNWRQGKDSAEYQLNRLNHAKKHFDRIIDGTGDWGDFQAVICNLAMICWWRVNGSGFAEAFPFLVEDNEAWRPTQEKSPSK